MFFSVLKSKQKLKLSKNNSNLSRTDWQRIFTPTKTKANNGDKVNTLVRDEKQENFNLEIQFVYGRTQRKKKEEGIKKKIERKAEFWILISNFPKKNSWKIQPV